MIKMKKVSDIGLMGRLMISFIIIIGITFIVMFIGMYMTIKSNSIRFVQQDIYHFVKKNNQLVDSIFLANDEVTKNIITDKTLYAAINSYNNREINSLEMDRVLRDVLSRNRFLTPEITSVFLYTSSYTFVSSADSSISSSITLPKSIIEKINLGGGSMIYLPTYELPDLYATKNNERNMIFSTARVVNSSFYSDNSYFYLEKDIEKPILAVNYNYSLFDKYFDDIKHFENGKNIVMDSNYNIIYSNDFNIIGETLEEDWTKSITNGTTGTFRTRIDNKEYIICYDKSSVTDWYFISKIPLGAAMAENLSGLFDSLYFTAIIVAVISLSLAFLLTRSISYPIKELISAIKISSKGDFSYQINLSGLPETRILMEEYNKMNSELDILVKENYEIKIREKDAFIKALQSQLNPHFLYNALNIINWMVIEGNEGAGDMIVGLSESLRYTAEDASEVPFIREYNWLQNYLEIMRVRFENMFTINFDIEKELFEYKVPKLFLQPIIENIFVHGFKNLEENGKGTINIKGYIDEEYVIFSVEDNGNGMSEDTVERIMNDNSSGMGIKNVNKRIKLLYGKEYGIKISSVEGFGTIMKVYLKK